MIDFLKKGMLAGLGAAVITKESAERALNEWVEKGKLTQEEARQAAEKMVNQGREEYEKARSEVSLNFEQLLGRANLASHRDFETLSARVAVLEAKMQAAEQAGTGEAPAESGPAEPAS